MYYKSREITAGWNIAYTAIVFEISAYGYSSVQAALQGWQESAGHAAIILNGGSWASFPWGAVGCGADEGYGYYYCWFGVSTDGNAYPNVSLYVA